MATCMSLTEEEAAFIDWLSVGQAIVGMKGRVQTQLNVRFPKLDIRKGAMRDGELAETNS